MKPRLVIAQIGAVVLAFSLDRLSKVWGDRKSARRDRASFDRRLYAIAPDRKYRVQPFHWVAIMVA